jgi:hypothetical protein
MREGNSGNSGKEGVNQEIPYEEESLGKDAPDQKPDLDPELGRHDKANPRENRRSCRLLPYKRIQEVNPGIRTNGDSEESSGRSIQKSKLQDPQFRLQKATLGNPLRIELRK